MKAKITNTSQATQGVHTDEGLAFLEPGETRTLTIHKDHVDRTKASKLLKVEEPDKPAKAAPADKPSE